MKISWRIFIFRSKRESSAVNGKPLLYFMRRTGFWDDPLFWPQKCFFTIIQIFCSKNPFNHSPNAIHKRVVGDTFCIARHTKVWNIWTNTFQKRAKMFASASRHGIWRGGRLASKLHTYGIWTLIYIIYSVTVSARCFCATFLSPFFKVEQKQTFFVCAPHT